MIRAVRTIVALPGKIFELTIVAKEIAGIVKGLTGMDLAVCVAFGGNPAELAWIFHAETMGQLEATYAKVLADTGYRMALKKLENLVVPGSTRDQFWMDV